jgi:imidazolonepropionase
LYEAALVRLAEMQAWGTTTCEVKSGYGLDTATELKMLRVIQRLAQDCNMTIKATFLGAHAIPPDTTKADYVERVVNEMLPQVTAARLAEFCDVFCEDFAFSVAESRRILAAARKFGLRLKIHADEIENSGGAELAAELGAISAEHLLVPSEPGLRQMKERGVTAVLLPGTSFFLRTSARAPVARMRELGLSMALGSDFNPGSSTLLAMPVVVSLACLHYGMTIKEALLGATRNAARALGLEQDKGSFMPGKDADIIILDAPSYQHVPYRLAHNPVVTVVRSGRILLTR